MESKEYINQMHNELDRIDRTRKRDKVEIVAQCLSQVRGLKPGGIDDNQIDIVAKLVKYCYAYFNYRFRALSNTCH